MAFIPLLLQTKQAMEHNGCWRVVSAQVCMWSHCAEVLLYAVSVFYE